MIYLEFREDARIVHLHGCASCFTACSASRMPESMLPNRQGNLCSFMRCLAPCIFKFSPSVHDRPKMNHYLDYLRTGNCQFGDLCSWVSRRSIQLWPLLSFCMPCLPIYYNSHRSAV